MILPAEYETVKHSVDEDVVYYLSSVQGYIPSNTAPFVD